jgi:hypothetical protein
MLLTFVAASIFLNGVNIDGLRNQSFEKCRSARIDERGDMHLDCPGYQVEGPKGEPVAPSAQPAAYVPTQITKHYWLVSENQDSVNTQYDMDVFINSKWLRKIKAADPQVVVDITRYLNPGPNKILFAATKHLEQGRKGTAPTSFMKITVGEGGEAGGNTVLIDNPLLECKRTAAEIENVNEEFTITGR